MSWFRQLFCFHKWSVLSRKGIYKEWVQCAKCKKRENWFEGET